MGRYGTANGRCSENGMVLGRVKKRSRKKTGKKILRRGREEETQRARRVERSEELIDVGKTVSLPLTRASGRMTLQREQDTAGCPSKLRAS